MSAPIFKESAVELVITEMSGIMDAANAVAPEHLPSLKLLSKSTISA